MTPSRHLPRASPGAPIANGTGSADISHSLYFLPQHFINPSRLILLFFLSFFLSFSLYVSVCLCRVVFHSITDRENRPDVVNYWLISASRPSGIRRSWDYKLSAERPFTVLVKPISQLLSFTTKKIAFFFFVFFFWAIIAACRCRRDDDRIPFSIVLKCKINKQPKKN